MKNCTAQVVNSMTAYNPMRMKKIITRDEDKVQYNAGKKSPLSATIVERSN